MASYIHGTYIGRRLYGLLHEAGFAHVELSFQPEAPCTARQGSRRGPVPPDPHRRGHAELAALQARAGASAGFCWNRARGVKVI